VVGLFSVLVGAGDEMTNSKEFYKLVFFEWLKCMGAFVTATVLIVCCAIALIYVGELIITR